VTTLQVTCFETDCSVCGDSLKLGGNLSLGRK